MSGPLAVAAASLVDKDEGAERAFAEAVAGDLELLAALHDREPTAEVVAVVQAGPIQDQLGVMLRQDAARAALEAFRLAAEALPCPATEAAIDELAAGYADVYLRYTYRAAPTESVWLTEDGLDRQEPMLNVRAFYRRHGLSVRDAANRPDDHIVLQLRFIAHLLRGGAADGRPLEAAVDFMDRHILRWTRRHAIRLVQARAPDWYAALSLLTASYLDEIRDHLAVMTGIARPEPEDASAKAEPKRSEAAQPYVPGVAPSW